MVRLCESFLGEGQELTNIINFYDYVEVQPPEVYDHLIQLGDFKDNVELTSHIRKIIEATKDAGKLIVATGDVHHFEREDKIYRKIIVNQKVPGGGRHPLAKSGITEIPSQHFRTTREMLEDFNFLPDDLAYEIVVENTNKVLDMVEEIEVIIDTGGIPFSPRVKSDDGESYLDCPRVVTDLVNKKAKEVTSIDDKYKDDFYLNSLSLDELSIDDFKKEYKNLFNKDIDLKESDLMAVYGCPRIVKSDLEINKIYISKDCTPISNNEFYFKTIKYTGDKDYYYVYQHVGEKLDDKYIKPKSNIEVKVDKFEGNEDKFDDITWIFDKDFNFVSTMDKIEEPKGDNIT